MYGNSLTLDYGMMKKEGFSWENTAFFAMQGSHILRGAIKTKKFTSCGKVNNFDDPTYTEIWKNWNENYFDIVAPPLTIAKIVPKSYQTDTWGLFSSYIGHIWTRCSIYITNISPIYHKNQGHISVLWILEKFAKFRPPLKSKLVYICELETHLWMPPFIWNIFQLLTLL